MFEPSQADVRRFFCGVYQKMQQHQSLQAIEQIAAYWIAEHPHFYAELSDLNLALANMHKVEPERENAFLHLSMHLTISEQCSIDQPRGIRHAVDCLSAKHNSLHLAHHEVMQALGNMLWRSQQNGVPPDGDSYLAEIHHRMSQLGLVVN